jgi:hypothetical protein
MWCPNDDVPRWSDVEFYFAALAAVPHRRDAAVRAGNDGGLALREALEAFRVLAIAATPVVDFPAVAAARDRVERSMVDAGYGGELTAALQSWRAKADAMSVERAKQYVHQDVAEVVPRVFVGNMYAAIDRAALLARGVTHVCCCVPEEPRFPDDFAYHIIAVEDKAHTNILAHLDGAFDFIDAALGSPGASVLVHCGAGFSRGPTVAAAYLVRRLQCSALAAVRTVQRGRYRAHPNMGFCLQLQAYANLCRHPAARNPRNDPVIGQSLLEAKVGEYVASVAAHRTTGGIPVNNSVRHGGNDRDCIESLLRCESAEAAAAARELVVADVETAAAATATRAAVESAETAATTRANLLHRAPAGESCGHKKQHCGVVSAPNNFGEVVAAREVAAADADADADADAQQQLEDARDAAIHAAYEEGYCATVADRPRELDWPCRACFTKDRFCAAFGEVHEVWALADDSGTSAAALVAARPLLSFGVVSTAA